LREKEEGSFDELITENEMFTALEGIESDVHDVHLFAYESEVISKKAENQEEEQIVEKEEKKSKEGAKSLKKEVNKIDEALGKFYDNIC
jgi:hypothetical protein